MASPLSKGCHLEPRTPPVSKSIPCCSETAHLQGKREFLTAPPNNTPENTMKTDNVPSESSIAEGETIKLTTRFGGLSRGKCWGKFFPGKSRPTGDFEWVEKNKGTLYLQGAGYYLVGSSDGYSREARAQFYLAPAN